MNKSIFLYLLLIIGLILISYESFFDSVYYKVLGIAVAMFAVFKLQSKIPSKTNIDDDNHLENE